jgi:MFS transporter, DHA1 family, tetracycline resistance protein
LQQLFAKNREASQAFVLVTVFLDVLGIGLIIPVLPSLIGQFTHSPDEQAHWYGLLSATYGTMQFFCTPLLGALSDRFGRRPVLLMSIFGLGCSLFVHATATSLVALLLVRIVSGGTAASFSVASAYMADITAPEDRAKAFGMIGAAFGLGFIFGPVLGGILGGHNVRAPFYAAGGLAVINWLYGYFVLPESLPKDRRSPLSLARANPFAALANLTKLRGVGLLVVVYGLAVFAQWTMQSTWILYTQFRFNWSVTQNGIALGLVGILSTVVQGGLQGPLITRFGERRVVLMGFASAACANALYGLVTVGWLMYVVMIGNLLAYASGPAMQSIISRAVSPREQGLLQGSLNSITSVAIIFSPLVGTGILVRVAHLPPTDWRLGGTFFLCAALSLMALIVAALHFRQQASPDWSPEPVAKTGTDEPVGRAEAHR